MIDVDWAKTQGKFSNSIALQLNGVFSTLGQYGPGKFLNTNDCLNRNGQTLKSMIYDWNYFLLYFEWFGLWICEEDVVLKERLGTNSSYYIKGITMSTFGEVIVPILLFSRNIEAWNIGFRREGGEFNVRPGSSLEHISGINLTDDEIDKLEMNTAEDQSEQLFSQPFMGLFSKEELQRTLPRNRQEFTEGLYTFKVAWASGIWRKVSLSAAHTMDDLHDIIQKAFQFDDDHLYTFFMDGRKWSNDCIDSPYDDSGHADASRIKIGSLGFFPKQTFLYLFDYGDEWTFTVEVERVDQQDEKVVQPFVKESIGEAPEQYRDFY